MTITLITNGVPLTGPVTALAAAGAANAAAIWQLADNANLIGTKSFKVIKIWGLNATAPGGNTLLHIGTGVGAGFVDVIPPIETINGLNFEYILPQPVEVWVDLTAYPVVATVTVQVEVLEIG